MNHKSFFLNLLVLLVVYTSCKTNKKSTQVEDQLPNIIYILADDLGYGDVGYQGQQKFETPNIDKLAADGMVFTQHYSGSTVCAPSRSTLLTGMHTGHTVIRGNKEVRPEGQYPMPEETYTLAEMLQESGYKTGIFGKWGLGFPGSEGDANNQGFDEFFGYNCQRLAHNYYPYYLWENQTKIDLKGNKGKGQDVYAPELIHEKSLEFIKANKDTPFFMYYATPLPHAELLVPEKYSNKYQGKFTPEKKFKGVDDGPRYKNGGYASQENGHAAFAGMISLLDKQVGELVSVLEDLEIADNTIVIFTSDNGPHKEAGADPVYFDSNGVYRGFKRDLYEGGIHVPMIAKWPSKIKAGSTNDHISAFWDVMPTFADITNHRLQYSTDGISFLPTLLGEENQPQHEYLYWEFHEKGGRTAVRKGKWKGIRYNVLKQPTKRIQLYNLEEDPSEKINVADQFPEVVKELTQLMETSRTPSEVFKFDATYTKTK